MPANMTLVAAGNRLVVTEAMVSEVVVILKTFAAFVALVRLLIDMHC